VKAQCHFLPLPTCPRCILGGLRSPAHFLLGNLETYLYPVPSTVPLHDALFGDIVSPHLSPDDFLVIYLPSSSTIPLRTLFTPVEYDLAVLPHWISPELVMSMVTYATTALDP